MLCVGIDVSARELEVATRQKNGSVVGETFENGPEGHGRLIRYLRKRSKSVRVCLESTGVYGLDLAVALERTTGIEVMVANPRAIAEFGKALLQRSKTDALDAEVILAFSERMPFVAWQPPAQEHLELRAITRRMWALKAMGTQEKNRLHAATFVAETPKTIRKSIDSLIGQLERHVAKLDAAASALVESDPVLSRVYAHLVSTKGIAHVSALHILGEIAVMPPDMTARQWVATAGLDPRQHDSGSSVHKPAHISKAGNRYLRAALYLPALTAIRWEPQVAAFYNKLVGRGKKPIQAQVAVMRKLLHSIHGMIRSDSDFDPFKFYAVPAAAGAVGTAGIAPFAISAVSIAH